MQGSHSRTKSLIKVLRKLNSALNAKRWFPNKNNSQEKILNPLCGTLKWKTYGIPRLKVYWIPRS